MSKYNNTGQAFKYVLYLFWFMASRKAEIGKRYITLHMGGGGRGNDPHT